MDLSASERLLREIETLDKVASGHGATGVLSVGLAPGLTNLLARHAHDSLGEADKIDITVLLGNGEHHGADAVRRTVRQLIAQKQISSEAHSRSAAQLRSSARLSLPVFGPIHPAATLSSSLLVTTRLTFESSAVTTLLFAAQRLRLFRLADSDAGLRLLAALFSRVHHGGERCGDRAATAAFGNRRADPGERRQDPTALRPHESLDDLTPAQVEDHYAHRNDRTKTAA